MQNGFKSERLQLMVFSLLAVLNVSDGKSRIVLCAYADDSLAYTTRNGDVVQLNFKTNESSVIIDHATLVSRPIVA